MKKYKEENHYSLFSKSNRYYVINYEIHGFYYSIGYKGYNNMGIEYSHWIEHKTDFKYFL